ncbi:Bifunctional protein BirA [Porphyromonas crevioricanis]|uniref:Bifunctional protein BirA n=2 Tax=Porphyromonas crevioricanis TaxID=393921 RepID=A0A2X4SVF2_9PORP|nr:Bifunctional protein BirA [Porphyromonas crevioricanis]
MVIMTHRLFHFDSLPSTNTYIRDELARGVRYSSPTTIVVDAQPGGRGQQGNTWYTPRGENITLTTYLETNLKATEQFFISELVALVALETVKTYLPESDKLSLKWPNDLYYGDRKLGGILIEHSITGDGLDYSLLGVGINVNETSFPTNLPNPISIRQISGYSHDITTLVEHYCQTLDLYVAMLETAKGLDCLHQEYLCHLYRREGYHPYVGGGSQFFARIERVLPNGLICLEEEGGQRRMFAFKELQFVLE